MNIKTLTSPGGITAWLVETRAVPMLSLRFAFEGGSVEAPPGKEGLATFLAQMLDEGAGPYGGLAFKERALDLGARIGFRAGRDTFAGSLDVLSESRDEAAQLLRLALTAPRLEADAADRIRQQLQVAITRSSREPDKVASAQWEAIAFAGHPYAQPALGTVASIAAITTNDLEAYRRRVFARDNLKVVAVGDIGAAALGALLDEVFGALPAAGSLTTVADVASLPAGRQAIVEIDVPQSSVVFGLEAMAHRDPDYMAAVVLNNIVGGGGFSSRLMEEVRVKRGLAYGVSTGLSTARHAAVWRGGVATRNELVGQSIEVIRAELKKVAGGTITARELQNAQSYLTGSYPLRFDANGKIAGELLGLRIEGLGPQYVGERNGLIEAVTLEDLNRVAQRLFGSGKLIVAIAGKPLLAAGSGAILETSAA